MRNLTDTLSQLDNRRFPLAPSVSHGYIALTASQGPLEREETGRGRPCPVPPTGENPCLMFRRSQQMLDEGAALALASAMLRQLAETLPTSSEVRFGFLRIAQILDEDEQPHLRLVPSELLLPQDQVSG